MVSRFNVGFELHIGWLLIVWESHRKVRSGDNWRLDSQFWSLDKLHFHQFVKVSPDVPTVQGIWRTLLPQRNLDALGTINVYGEWVYRRIWTTHWVIANCLVVTPNSVVREPFVSQIWSLNKWRSREFAKVTAEVSILQGIWKTLLPQRNLHAPLASLVYMVSRFDVGFELRSV